MKPVKKRKATGVLAMLLAENREVELRHTRKRMMLAAKIADAIQSVGYSQKDFAAKMHKSETVISEWLSGDRNFTVDTLTDIEEVLGIRLLDVNTMTVVCASAEISQKVFSNSRNTDVIKLNGTWNYHPNNLECDYSIKYA